MDEIEYDQTTLDRLDYFAETQLRAGRDVTLRIAAEAEHRSALLFATRLGLAYDWEPTRETFTIYASKREAKERDAI